MPIRIGFVHSRLCRNGLGGGLHTKEIIGGCAAGWQPFVAAIVAGIQWWYFSIMTTRARVKSLGFKCFVHRAGKLLG